MDLRELLSEALRRPVARSTGLVSSRIAEELRTEEHRARALQNVGKFLGREVSGDDVRIAGADVCNNVIDSYDSRFAESSLRAIGKKIVGSTMACGHDMSGWAYATTFAGRVDEPADGARSIPMNARGMRELRDVKAATWVRSQYYWPAKASFADDLALRIEYQLTREVSAHWAFDLAVCSICEDDMRKCEHFPGEEYDGKRCWYEMRDVTDYIETSFVIKGGQYGTSTYPLEGRGLRCALPFGEAIREVKSNRKLWDGWRAEIKDAVEASKGFTRVRRAGDVNVDTDARDFFARALAGKKPAAPATV